MTTRTCGWCVNRRAFLTGMAGAAGLWALGRGSLVDASVTLPTVRTKIRLVFSHHQENAEGKQSEAGWPYLGYDSGGRKKELLEKLRQSCPQVDFLPVTAVSREDAKKLLQSDREVDGYLAYMVGGWAGAAETIAAAGRPVIFAGDLYGASGEILVAYAVAKRLGQKVVSVSSSRFEDVVEAVRSFECLKRLRASTIVVVGAGRGEIAKGIEDVFGTKVVSVDFPPLNEAYAKADRGKARELAARWIREAQKVVEPSAAEVEKSAAMYLAIQALMAQHQAQAITINCLGGFYGGHMEAYPCLGHFQLNNDGLVGACEADLQSTLTMLLMTYLVGRPGYISDPVVDTATHQVIYVHCVAPNKVLGPQGPTNPYQIRSHAEDRKGAAVQSLMPLGQMVTTIQIAPTRRQIILHQAKTVANVDDHKSCRTKLAAELKGDMDKLLSSWDLWGWHRVTFYGDHKRAVRQIAALAGFSIIEEA